MKDFFKGCNKTEDVYVVKPDIPDEILDEMPKYTKTIEERFSSTMANENMDDYMLGMTKEMRLKDAYNEAGMFAFVSWKWVNPFVDWIGNRKVLEVMAGRGWLSYALKQKGVNVIATDDYSWSKNRQWKAPLTEVQELDAVESVNKYGEGIDLLVMAWPYMDNTAYKVIKRLYEVNPKALVVYIGEGSCGCTADDSFFNHFCGVLNADEYDQWRLVIENYQSWNMIHDRPMIGRYCEEEE